RRVGEGAMQRGASVLTLRLNEVLSASWVHGWRSVAPWHWRPDLCRLAHCGCLWRGGVSFRAGKAQGTLRTGAKGMSTSAVNEFTTALERGDELLTRKKLQEKIAVLEEFNRLLVESVGDCILIVDGSGRVLSINAAGRELLQLPPNQIVLHRHWTT